MDGSHKKHSQGLEQQSGTGGFAHAVTDQAHPRPVEVLLLFELCKERLKIVRLPFVLSAGLVRRALGNNDQERVFMLLVLEPDWRGCFKLGQVGAPFAGTVREDPQPGVLFVKLPEAGAETT